MGVQTLGPEATVEASIKSLSVGFTWPREVERNAAVLGPQNPVT